MDGFTAGTVIAGTIILWQRESWEHVATRVKRAQPMPLIGFAENQAPSNSQEEHYALVSFIHSTVPMHCRPRRTLRLGSVPRAREACERCIRHTRKIYLWQNVLWQNLLWQNVMRHKNSGKKHTCDKTIVTKKRVTKRLRKMIRTHQNMLRTVFLEPSAKINAKS